jgi:hypothetical protein
VIWSFGLRVLRGSPEEVAETLAETRQAEDAE